MTEPSHSEKSGVKDREGKVIEVGDHIETPIKLGRHEGEVSFLFPQGSKRC